MKTRHFARLFEFDLEGEKAQFLIYAEPDGEETIIHQIVNFDDAQVDAKMTSSADPDEIEKKVSTITEQMAEQVFRGIIRMVGGQ